MWKFVYRDNIYINIRDSDTCNDVMEINRYFTDIINSLGVFDYAKKGSGEESYLRCLLGKISNWEAFCCALFIVRNMYKIAIYNNVANADILYKVLNYLFFISMNQKILNSQKCINEYEKDNLSIILKLAYSIVVRYYEKTDELYDKDAVENYRKRKFYVTNLKEDMNTYEFQYRCLREYVEKFNLFSVECLPGYLSETELERVLSFMDDYALNEIEDEAIRVYSNKFISSFADATMEFIRRFEFTGVQLRLMNPFDERWDFVCCYKSDKYLIISPILLRRNIFATKVLSKWCHGQETVFKFFFNYTIPSKYKNNYDNYIAYKIVDILITNSYIVPSQKWNNEYIPRANIGDYLDDRFLCKQYGDLDAVFYSPHTDCIYIVEFKNVQMTSSRIGDLNYDIKKMEKWEIGRHVREREEAVRSNISEFINRVFKYDAILIPNNNDVEVKSIVLTTTPNFYFFQYPSADYIYMDWVEFKGQVTKKEL